jgi:hypothetical protein
MSGGTHPCFGHIRWRPDARELKRFALAMPVGFGILGALAVLQAHAVTPAATFLWCLGPALGALSLVRPLARTVYLAVNVPAAIAGYLMSQLILLLMFALVFAPMGFLLRLLGRDLLDTGKGRCTAWKPVEQRRGSSHYYRQF